MSARPARTPNHAATLVTCPNNQEPTFGRILASQPVAVCRVSRSSALSQNEAGAGPLGASAASPVVFVRMVPEVMLVPLPSFVPDGAALSRPRNLRKRAGGLLAHLSTPSRSRWV